MLVDLIITASVLVVAFIVTYTLYPKLVSATGLPRIFHVEEKKNERIELVVSFLKKHKVYIILAIVILSLMLMGLYVFVLPAVICLFFLKRYRQYKMKAEVVQNLAPAINIMKTALKGGLPLQGAIKNVADYSTSPRVQEIFKRIYYMSGSMGRPMNEVIAEESRRLGIAEMIFLSSVIETHIEVGGNLADMLGILEENIRRLLITKQKVSSLLAEGRMSATILSIIPVAAAFLLLKTNRHYMAFFLGPGGRTGLIAAAAFYLFGVFVAFRMIRIKV